MRDSLAPLYVSPPGRRPRALLFTAAALVTVMVWAAIDTAASQQAVAPRLREAPLPLQMPQALGGGEVVLEVTVDARGTVGRVDRVRETPPYTDAVATWTAGWQFEPAAATTAGRRTGIDAPVLVVALFRPPSFYAGPAPGEPPRTRGAPSARLPSLQSLVMAVYPPTATGDGVVLVEVEMSRRAEARSYRIVGASSGFDGAALDAVRAWRFGAPKAADVPDALFVYAVVGFRVPLAPGSPRRE
jgi:outer membrane biosynthesis protein TonB